MESIDGDNAIQYDSFRNLSSLSTKTEPMTLLSTAHTAMESIPLPIASTMARSLGRGDMARETSESNPAMAFCTISKVVDRTPQQANGVDLVKYQFRRGIACLGLGVDRDYQSVRREQFGLLVPRRCSK